MRKLNNKGFTLVELIATIVILALVLSITGYSIVNLMEASREEDYKLLIENINNAVELYYQECKYVKDNCQSEITLGDLVTDGYLKGNGTLDDGKFTLVNPKDMVDISGCKIKYTYSDGKVKVEAVDPTGSCPTDY